VTLTPVYNDDGPFEVKYSMKAIGNGGQETVQTTTTIFIDLEPDNISIPETEGNKEEDPLFTPDPEKFPDIELEILDVDIPVEIKSDKPIKVSLDDGNTWLNVREKS
jgi:hypothetical protein